MILRAFFSFTCPFGIKQGNNENGDRVDGRFDLIITRYYTYDYHNRFPLPLCPGFGDTGSVGRREGRVDDLPEVPVIRQNRR